MKTRLLFPLVLILSITLLLQLREDRFLIVLHATTSPSSTRHTRRHDEDDTIKWFEEPYVNRWQRKFHANPTERRQRGGGGGGGYYLFFKHIRKAGASHVGPIHHCVDMPMPCSLPLTLTDFLSRRRRHNTAKLSPTSVTPSPQSTNSRGIYTKHLPTANRRCRSPRVATLAQCSRKRLEVNE